MKNKLTVLNDEELRGIEGGFLATFGTALAIGYMLGKAAAYITNDSSESVEEISPSECCSCSC